jgi:2-amino-4-hydroxy-6-hydroxymethyldihydropteridine diphosphokinase
MSRVCIGLGTNLGDKEENLKSAIRYIEESSGQIVSCSSVYETAPWGFRSRNKFLNMVIIAETRLLPEELLDTAIRIEKLLGRVRRSRHYISRVIDIDILLYDNFVIDKENLKIPHPLMQNRRFVLVPLCEIAAGLIHPVLKKSICELLGECKDKCEVTRKGSL